MIAGISTHCHYFYIDIPHITSSQLSNQTFCLLLPGSTLDLSSLLQSKKFRSRGNKDGALTAMKALEADGLGKLLDKGAHRGTSVVSTAVQSIKIVLNFILHAQVYKFKKAPIPENNIEDFATKLAKYGLSLQDYQKALKENKEPLQR